MGRLKLFILTCHVNRDVQSGATRSNHLNLKIQEIKISLARNASFKQEENRLTESYAGHFPASKLETLLLRCLKHRHSMLSLDKFMENYLPRFLTRQRRLSQDFMNHELYC